MKIIGRARCEKLGVGCATYPFYAEEFHEKLTNTRQLKSETSTLEPWSFSLSLFFII